MHQPHALPGIYLLILLIYLAIIWIVLSYGRKRNIGLGWTIVFSIFLSPLVALIIAFASGKKKRF